MELRLDICVLKDHPGRTGKDSHQVGAFAQREDRPDFFPLFAFKERSLRSTSLCAGSCWQHRNRQQQKEDQPSILKNRFHNLQFPQIKKAET
jgi:hypothetical protein